MPAFFLRSITPISDSSTWARGRTSRSKNSPPKSHALLVILVGSFSIRHDPMVRRENFLTCLNLENLAGYPKRNCAMAWRKLMQTFLQREDAAALNVRRKAALFSGSDDDKTGGIDYRNCWSGRQLSGRNSVGKRLRRPRCQTAVVFIQHRPHRSSLPRSARTQYSLFPALRRPHGRHQSHPYHAGSAADGNLQSRRSEPRASEFRDARIYGKCRCAGYLAPA